MSTDRPERLSDRIAGLWNDRPRADRSNEPLSRDHSSNDHPFANESFDHPADRFADRTAPDRIADRTMNRTPARFSDLEPVTPISGSSASADFPASLSPSPSSAPGPTPARIRSWSPQPSEPTPRAVGSPLPTGSASSSGPSPSSSTQLVSPRINSAPQPAKNLALGRGLPPSGSAAEALPGTDLPSSVQKIVNAVRATLPFIQRILPLLDGNIGTAVSNLMAPPAPPIHRPAPPPPPVDLAPIEEGISSLQTQQHELRTQIADQNTSLKRVEDQLEMVREATDRNTLEQQELLEDLKGIGNKVNIFAMVALLLLVVSVMVNVILYLHIKRVLP